MSKEKNQPTYSAFNVRMLRGLLFLFLALGGLTIIAAVWVIFMH
jgi:hypothetical protein